MKSKHVAFIVESVYGHLVPTLGIATELIRRGHRVSYALKERFVQRISSIGAEPKSYAPLENKLKLFAEMNRLGIEFFTEDCTALWTRLRREETSDTLSQLTVLYRHDMPDLIIYDFMSPAGKLLGVEFGTPAIEHSPMVITYRDPLNPDWCYNEKLTVVSVPRFFQRDADDLDDRFQFVGFAQNDRCRFFDAGAKTDPRKATILVSATTGLLTQNDFFRTAISAFADTSFQIVASIGKETPASALGSIPSNCHINRSHGNFDLLAGAALCIGQAGQGTILESIYHGVPQLLVPPSPVHNDLALRVEELGLGSRLDETGATIDNVRRAGLALLQDAAMQDRLRTFSRQMHQDRAADKAATLIESCISW